MNWEAIAAIVAVCVGAAVTIVKIFAGVLDTALTREMDRLIGALGANENAAKDRHAMTLAAINAGREQQSKEEKKTRKKLEKVLLICGKCPGGAKAHSTAPAARKKP